MTRTKLEQIMSQIIFKDEWFVIQDKGDGWLIQLRYNEPDIDVGKVEVQHARKWYISSYATESEVVRTALLACLVSSEHRVREHFYYKNKRLFGPHIDVSLLSQSAPELWEDHRIHVNKKGNKNIGGSKR